MKGSCCAAMLPAAGFALLPKCPLCLAIWLTATTGVGVSAEAAQSLTWSAIASWLLVLAHLLRDRWPVARRGFRHRAEERIDRVNLIAPHLEGLERDQRITRTVRIGVTEVHP